MPSSDGPVWSWDVTSVAELPRVRAELRARLDTDAGQPGPASAPAERLLLVVDELTSNALRHGRGPVHARVITEDGCWLVDVSDAAVARAPHEAVDRDLTEGGMGLYLIAAYAGPHGWCTVRGRKHVWAAVPHDHQLPSEPVLPSQRVARAVGDTGPAAT